MSDDFKISVETVKEFLRRRDHNWIALHVAAILFIAFFVVIGFLSALSLTACGTLPTGIRLSSEQCLDLAERRDGALLAGKILAGVGGVAPLAAVPDEVPENARWGVGAGAATTAAVGVAVIWYGERKGEMFEAYCTSSASEPSTGDGGVEQ